MKLKQRVWKFATAIVVFALITTILPEAVALGFVIDGIGLEIFLLLLKIQGILVIGLFFQIQVMPVIVKIHLILTTIDANYFLPDKSTIIQYPPILFHAIPGFLSLYWMFLLYVAYV